MKPTLVLIGIGNHGRQYERTRHNAGYLALDVLAEHLKTTPWKESQKFMASLSEGLIDEQPVLLVKPRTYVNRSGECVRKIIDFYSLDSSTQLLVCVDDIDLPLGTYRFRLEGGPGTHNGLKSIVQCIGQEFPRYRLGLGAPSKEIDLAAWVLSRLSDEEMNMLHSSCAELLPSARTVIASQSK